MRRPRFGLLAARVCSLRGSESRDRRGPLRSRRDVDVSPEVTEIGRRRRRRRRADRERCAMQTSDGVAVIGETLWIRGRAFGRQPAVTGRRASRGRAGADARRRHRRARAARDAVRVAAGGREQRGRPRRAADRGPALRGGAGAGRRSRSAGPSSGRTGRSPRAPRRCAGRAGWRCRPTGAPPTSPRRRASIVDVVEIPAPGGPKVVYRLDLGDGPIVALAAAARAPVLAVVREDDVLLLDTSSPLRPARSAPRALPPGDSTRARRRRRPVARRQAAGGRHRRRQPRRAAGSGAARPRGAGGRAVDPARRPRRACWSTSRFRPPATRCGCCRATRRAAAPAGPQPTELRALRLGASPESLSKLEVARVVDVGAARDPARIGGRPRAAAGQRRRDPPAARARDACSSRPLEADYRDGTLEGPAPRDGPDGHSPHARRDVPTRRRCSGSGSRTRPPSRSRRSGGWACPICRSTAAGCWRRSPRPTVRCACCRRRWTGVPRPRRPRCDVVRAGPGETAPADRPVPQLRIQP